MWYHLQAYQAGSFGQAGTVKNFSQIQLKARDKIINPL